MTSDNQDEKNTFYRTIKTFVLRAGRMTESQERDYHNLVGKWCIPFSTRHLNYYDIFNNTNKLTVEIGFGMGTATAIIAHENPEMNYIGIEVHRPGVGRLLGEIQKRELKNLFIIEHDALEVLDKMIPNNSVDAFHIFFPDPWPKKKHHKRRLVQRPRTDLLAQKLIPGGYLYMATDWEPYAEFALEQLENTPGLKNKYEKYAEHQSWRPETKFEKKGVVAQRPINELYFVKEQ